MKLAIITPVTRLGSDRSCPTFFFAEAAGDRVSSVTNRCCFRPAAIFWSKFDAFERRDSYVSLDMIFIAIEANMALHDSCFVYFPHKIAFSNQKRKFTD